MTIIRGKLRNPDETPQASKVVLFELLSTGIIPDTVYPPKQVKIRTDADGAFEQEIWSNERGDTVTSYNVTLPGAKPRRVTVPNSVEPLELSALLLAGVTPLDPEYQTLLTFINTQLEQVSAGPQGDPGQNGADGLSAYDLAVQAGFAGTLEQWLASLEGAPGLPGATGASGADGATGQNGLSAYEVAVQAGFVGTETAWLESLRGAKGDTGEAFINIDGGRPSDVPSFVGIFDAGRI